MIFFDSENPKCSKIKTIGLILTFITVSSSCGPTFSKWSENQVFGKDIISADGPYYTKAVLEYNLVKKALRKFNPSREYSYVNLTAVSKKNPEEIVYDCSYWRPSKLKHLNSGFQFRYYLFDGSTEAALQAFGIANIKRNASTKYLVIDYIQYKDYYCTNLPTTRYAVGLRSEMKFEEISDSIDITGRGLANLAAQVQLGNAKVDFSIKTIGLTGLEARTNIPQGVSFNVSTYKDFQNAIEFLKTHLEQKEENGDLEVSPEIIPVLDEYRPNPEATFEDITKRVIQLTETQEELGKLDSGKLSDSAKERISGIYDTRIKNYLNEMDIIKELESEVYSMKPFLDSYQNATISYKMYKKNFLEYLREREKRVDSSGNTVNFFPDAPNLEKIKPSLLLDFEDLIINTDNLDMESVRKFLQELNEYNLNDTDFLKILEMLKKNPENSQFGDALKLLEEKED